MSRQVDSSGSHKPHAGGASKSSTDLMTLIHEAGFQGNAANIMYGIVMAESGGNAQALNNNSNTGDLSYGLAQINMIGSMGPQRLQQYGLSSNDDLYDPLTNLKVAYALSNGGRDFTPWSTFKSGAYQQFTGQSGAQITNGGHVATGAGPHGSGSGDVPTQDQYLGVDSLGNLLKQVPQLAKILQQAESGGWSIDTFTNAVENSAWFKTHNQNVRAALVEQANDPATWSRHLQNVENSITTLSKNLGFPVNGSMLTTIATNAIMTGNESNTDWLTQALGRQEQFRSVHSGADLNGQMASAFQQLQQWSQQYGIQMSVGALTQQAQQVAMGNGNLDHYRENFVNLAMGKYPGLVSQLEAGQTVQQIADPYIQQYANLLELDPNGVDFNKTPLIQQALQGQPTGQGSQKALMSLNDFEKQVRTDPRWQYTQNARDTFSTALVNIGHDFGFGF